MKYLWGPGELNSMPMHPSSSLAVLHLQVARVPGTVHIEVPTLVALR